MSVTRIYVEKMPAYAVEAAGTLGDLRAALPLPQGLTLRLLNRYDVEGLSPEDFAMARGTIFSEPQVDLVYDRLPATEGRVFGIELLPGQFDQRADSCEQCIQISTQKERPRVRSARIYLLEGAPVTDQELSAIKAFLINPVETREAALELPETLEVRYPIPTAVETLTGFTQLDRAGLEALLEDRGLAMDCEDLLLCQGYFRDTEHRDPTVTELRMIDTYWSDHCRHTTFGTNLTDVAIETDYILESYRDYLRLREAVHAGKDRPVTLMDLATIGAKALRQAGKLPALDVSPEVNACSVKITVDKDGVDEDWLLMFKNETHNHPTEIEPFGGAATCLGGAIRDPLSGRSYVYQAMRLTGAGNPLESHTLAGKLSQRKLVTTAAAGYSSYGNQIGLTTGHVTELYHPGYVAKRMEVGAVMGAAPAENVRREEPAAGDVVILLGGATGRDGCGGATGSSKTHTAQSLESCGAEVQKGNAPEERKIQRLFRDGTVTRMIKRCNDFGAGGVSVAIGELADGLEIDLDAVPKKYEGLDGTELAISESQERMAVVVAAADAEAFIAAAAKENLSATQVAVVTDRGRLSMDWNGVRIVDLSREFLNSSGATKYATVRVEAPEATAATAEPAPGKTLAERWEALMGSLNVCSQKGLVDRFDSTVGGNTVLLPFGGRRQRTPAQAMSAKLPVLGGETTTASLMAWGFDPTLSERSPYHGAMMAVVDSVAKVVAAGGSRQRCWLSFQEYFEKLGSDPTRWGKPFAALLGALKAQQELETGAIGGKDSMSGTFEDTDGNRLDVPPTLISFAVSTAHVDNIVSPEFKGAGNSVYLLACDFDQRGLPDFDSLRRVFDTLETLIAEKTALSVWTVGRGGVAEGLAKMAFGNAIGFAFAEEPPADDLFAPRSGAFLVECSRPLPGLAPLGRTTEEYTIRAGGATLGLEALEQRWEEGLSGIFPAYLPADETAVPTYTHTADRWASPAIKVAKPRVLIPTFPGSNCEYDTARAFERAGATAEIFVVHNRTAQDIEESIRAFEEKIAQAQIIALPGGFSGGDEPDGSGKFITAFFRGARLMDAVHRHLGERDGLMCGICNGFQALVKLGLLPFGEILDMDAASPTLTFNSIGRHQSTLCHTRVASNMSPWMMHCTPGELYTTAVSHGEGRFVASEETLRQMAERGQIAAQYVDLSGVPTMDSHFNPNGSLHAIESITSPDGRVLGKMAHSERTGHGTHKNVPGNLDQPIFRGAVDYFTK